MTTEAEWETIAHDQLAEHGWEPLSGAEIRPGTPRGRTSWAEPHLPDRTLEALRRLNPQVPGEYLVQGLAEITEPRSQDAIAENHRIHTFLVHGYRGITWTDADGVEHNPTIRLLGQGVDDNDWLAVTQVTLRSLEHERRFDLVLYLNGLPVAVVELKKAASEQAGLASAHAQLATYLREFPLAFRFTVASVVSDGITARYGTPFTPFEHYAPWNVDDNGAVVDLGATSDDEDKLGVALEVLIDGVFNPERFLQLLREFTAYDEGADGLVKRIAKPHQYFAVSKAVGATVQAAETNGRAGVVWHTQGSGKSMEMELYANKVARQPKLKNPTIVVVTDRTELDGQLYETFQRSTLLPEKPVAVRSRTQLRTELAERTTGGIYFTTLQKFGLSPAERAAGTQHPLLTDRRNVIIVVDEAHRSHYDDLDGYARHLRDALPHATLIAFTGTPISFEDRDTRAVFGGYIDVYDLTRAVEDGATVPVHFEPRLIQVTQGLSQEELDLAADEASEGLDQTEREKVEKAVARMNAVYGAPARLEALAADVVAHWEQRSGAMEEFLRSPGKAMIVGATREICANLYAAIVALRPDWHDDAVDAGRIKVVYSGDATDTGEIAKHVRREGQNKAIKERLRDPDDALQIVIVKDMMLTGYDSPPLHTLYLDRPLKGALLMQTLARVNRTFRGKQDGLLVAYAPLADDLAKALAEYTDSDRTTRPVGRDIDEAVLATRELIGRLDELCAGYAWRSKLDGGPRSWIRACHAMTNHLRSPQTPGNQVAEGEKTLSEQFRALSNQLARMWALCSGRENLADLQTEARFYEEVRVWQAKFDAEEARAGGRPLPEDVQRALAKLVATTTETGEVVDIYEAAGIPRPTLSDLTPAYTQQAQQATNPHLAIEALRALLTEESSTVTRNNVVRQRAFSERVRELMTKYTNQQLTSAEVIAELVDLAKEVAAEARRGERFDPPLSGDELAFYDAVSDNESAVQEQGEDVLAQIARELIAVMRRDVTTDWTVRDDVRAKLRSSVRRLLMKHKYPPDKQPEAIALVIEQMEAMALRGSV